MNAGLRPCLLIIAVLTFGCATHSPRSGPSPVLEPGTGESFSGADTLSDAAADSLFEFSTVGSPLDTLSTEIPTIPDSLLARGRERVRVQEDSLAYDLPIEVNDRVLTFLDSYTGKQADWFKRTLDRSGRVLPMIHRIFAEEGVPHDLAYMAHVESAYRYNARSRAGAIGLWQFMRGTAKLNGLLCNAYVDERLDPEKSTRAAARHLKILYQTFGDWHLAMAAYNAGEGKVTRAMKRAGTKDFWKLARTRYLKRETRNYVPAILAAIIISKSPEEFGFAADYEEPLEYDVVHVESVTHVNVIARCCDVPVNVVRALNPALIASQTPPGHHPYEVRIPKGSAEMFAAAIEKISPEDRMLYRRHRVRNGETLSLLASRYGTSVSAIQMANQMGRRTMIREGSMILIPASSWDTRDPLAELVAPGERVTHRVRRGETLSTIARRYGTTVAAVQRWNGLASPHHVRAGQILTLFAGGGESAPAAAPARRETPRPGELTTHTVQAGESLWSVARQYGLTVNQLRSLNGQLRGKTLIRPGQKLTVTAPSDGDAIVHRVARGETLWDIAARYGTTVGDIRRWNGMSSRRTLIHPGDRLTLYRN